MSVAVLSASQWIGWFAWDSEYQIDPVTRVESGPYETWQGVGAGLGLIVILLGALLLRVPPVPACAALTVGFSFAWAATTMPGDATGLSGVGLIMVFVGVGMASAVFALLVTGVRGLWTRRHA